MCCVTHETVCHTRHARCVTQQTCLLCDLADMSAQQTCLLFDTADMSAVRQSRHFSVSHSRQCLLCRIADMSAVAQGRLCREAGDVCKPPLSGRPSGNRLGWPQWQASKKYISRKAEMIVLQAIDNKLNYSKAHCRLCQHYSIQYA